MTQTVLQMLLFILPVVVAGVGNMLLVRSPLLKRLDVPMDGGRRLGDGRRIFGDNKTWRGFVGMTMLTAVAMGVFGIVTRTTGAGDSWQWIDLSAWPPWRDWVNGAGWGLLYVLFELPNSFVKRRLDIAPGETASHRWRPVFVVVDQADSTLGLAVAAPLLFGVSVSHAAGLFVVGTGVHYIVNFGLYLARIKKRAG